jgi:hypothetical protein
MTVAQLKNYLSHFPDDAQVLGLVNDNHHLMSVVDPHSAIDQDTNKVSMILHFYTNDYFNLEEQ